MARTPVAAEKLGARYAVLVQTNPMALPEAAATQRNGRTVSPVVQRSRPNFDAAASASYL